MRDKSKRARNRCRKLNRTLNIRLQDSLLEGLQRAAEVERRAVPDLVRLILEDRIAQAVPAMNGR
jgi:hypothetical protein